MNPPIDGKICQTRYKNEDIDGANAVEFGKEINGANSGNGTKDEEQSNGYMTVSPNALEGVEFFGFAEG